MRVPDQALLHGRSKGPLDEIEVLHLSYCNLDAIYGLDICCKLRSLYLDGNKLTEIQQLEKLPCLWKLDLSNNKISQLEGLQSFKCLGYLSLKSNCITYDELLKLREIPIVELYLLGNDSLTIHGSASQYRMKVISMLPNVWILDGHFITHEERLMANTKFDSCSAEIVDRLDTFGSVDLAWKLDLNSRGKHIQTYLEVVRNQPTNEKIIDSYRLKFIAKYYEEESQVHNYYTQFSACRKSLNSKTLPRMHLQELLDMSQKDRLNLAILLACFLEYSIPTSIAVEALAAIFLGVLSIDISSGLIHLPSFSLTTILHHLCAAYDEQGSHKTFGGNISCEHIWNSIPKVVTRLLTINERDPEKMSNYSFRCYQAVTLLSRAPTFPSLLDSNINSSMKKYYQELLPLLTAAKLLKGDEFYENIANEQVAWLGGKRQSNVDVKGVPSQLPWNASDHLTRDYSRPWKSIPSNLVKTVTNKDKKIDAAFVLDCNKDDSLRSPSIPKAGEWVEVSYRQYVPISHVTNDGEKIVLKPFPGMDKAPFCGKLCIPSILVFRISTRIWKLKHDQPPKINLPRNGRLHRVSHGFHKNGIPRSHGVININISGRTKHIDKSKSPLSKIEAFTTNSTWNSNYVLAPSSLIELQNSSIDKPKRKKKKNAETSNNNSESGWCPIDNAPYLIEEDQHIVDMPPQLAPVRSSVSTILALPNQTEKQLQKNKPEVSKALDCSRDDEWEILQKEMGSLLGITRSFEDLQEEKREIPQTNQREARSSSTFLTAIREENETIQHPQSGNKIENEVIKQETIVGKISNSPIRKAGFRPWYAVQAKEKYIVANAPYLSATIKKSYSLPNL